MSNIKNQLKPRLAKKKTEIMKWDKTGPTSGKGRRALRKKSKYEHYELRKYMDMARGGSKSTSLYSLYDKTNGRCVCVKIFEERNPAVIELFQRIARTRKSIGQSNHLIDIYEFAVLKGKDSHPALFMELGVENLKEKIEGLREEGKQFDLEEILYVSERVCTAVKVVHEHDLANVDLKTEHVVYTEDGLIKLCDVFESVKPHDHTTKTLKVTPEYTGPETAAESYKADKRSDIYPFGLILYEMLKLEPFFYSDENGETIKTDEEREEMKNNFEGVKAKLWREIDDPFFAAIIEGCLHPNYITEEEKRKMKKIIAELQELEADGKATTKNLDEITYLQNRLQTGQGEEGLRYQTIEEPLRDLELLKRHESLRAYDAALSGINLSDGPTAVKAVEDLIDARNAFYSGLEIDASRVETSRILPNLEERFKEIISYNAAKALELARKGGPSVEENKQLQSFKVLFSRPFQEYGDSIVVHFDTEKFSDSKSHEIEKWSPRLPS